MIKKLQELTARQKATIAFVVLVTVVFVSIVCVFVFGGKSDNNQTYNLKKANERVYSSSTSSSSEIDTTPSSDQTPQEQAKSTLETQKKETDQAKVDKAKAAIQTALDYIKKTDAKNIKPDYQNKVSLTSTANLSTFKSIFKAKYDYDINTLVVYTSDNDNVEQFTFDLKKDGGNTVTIAGNYVPSTDQVELVQIKGIPSGLTHN
ncbi:TPA: hypothetical protein ACGWER_001728 [Streptococcus agalactiae]|nr:hypothetical protein [Streptococcus agalactiae]HEO2267377.1 hypothetical protein [Streptococcus agalactiae]HEO7770449.1 hypothetical protein [Streptococcus agalactiae]